MLQYITNTDCTRPVVDQIKAVVAGGCKWVQIRMKDASDNEIRNVVGEVKRLCADNDVLLVLDDRVALAKELELSGVHLGKEDMPPSKARLELGPAAIIGVTANEFDDILAVRALDIDYIGMGPFTRTSTKRKLAPILGLEGIKNLCSQMEEKEIEIARVAVGGIKLDDVDALMEAGVNGVAVSGDIARADDMEKQTRLYLEKLSRYEPSASDAVK